MSIVFLAKMTQPEIEEYIKKCDVVLLPVGAIEQHGKHLPVETDAYIANEVSRRIAVKAGVLVAPVVPFGDSASHMHYKGSITLTFDTLVRVYKEVCVSLLRHGFKKIVIINGHGGNISAINEALKQIRVETGDIVYNIPAWCSDSGFGKEVTKVLTQEGGGHACEEETSTSLYLGQRVEMDKAEKWKQPGDQPALLRKYQGKAKVYQFMDETTDVGNNGDPTIATWEKGKILVDTLVDEVSEFIEDLKKL